MTATELLGLPLEEALRRWAEAGRETPCVVCTADPRGQRQTGTLRVIRVRDGEWTVARFFDADPVPTDA